MLACHLNDSANLVVKGQYTKHVHVRLLYAIIKFSIQYDVRIFAMYVARCLSVKIENVVEKKQFSNSVLLMKDERTRYSFSRQTASV